MIDGSRSFCGGGGKGVEKNVAAWTHLKGVEWAACDEKSKPA